MHRTSRPLLYFLMLLFLAQAGLQFALAGMGSVAGHDGGTHRVTNDHDAPAADAYGDGGHYNHQHAGENCAAYQCSACLANLPPIALQTADSHNARDLPYAGRWLASRDAAAVFRPPRA